MSEWIPIESAPKDGTEILAAQAGTPEWGVIYWDSCWHRWNDPADHHDEPNWKPTHWMQPDPPKGPSGGNCSIG